MPFLFCFGIFVLTVGFLFHLSVLIPEAFFLRGRAVVREREGDMKLLGLEKGRSWESGKSINLKYTYNNRAKRLACRL